MFFNDRETIIRLTPQWTGPRLDDGRPMVSRNVLDRMRNITFEEAWGPLWNQGYRNNWETNFRMTAGEQVLVGRAVTAVMVPMRPDLNDALMKIGHEDEGYKGFYNQWVIDRLVEDDVVVVDLYDKIFEGTYVGGNLSTAIRTRTKRGGAVIWGGIRDLQQIVDIPDFQVYYRGIDPTPIGDVMLSGINRPCAIGKAICMPGDVVLGTMSGVLFIPAHLAEDACIAGEKEQCRDLFGFERIREGIYTSAQIDTRWTEPIMEDFLSWFAASPTAADYQHLTWDEEIELSKRTDIVDFAGLIQAPIG